MFCFVGHSNADDVEEHMFANVRKHRSLSTGEVTEQSEC